MNKYINGNGFLTPAGQELLAPLKAELEKVIQTIDPESDNDLRTIGSVLSKLVGDTISNTMQVQKEAVNKFADMSDEEFQAYLEFTYGVGWQMKSITKEEMARLKPILKKQVEAAFEKMKEERQKQGYQPRGMPRIPKIYID